MKHLQLPLLLAGIALAFGAGSPAAAYYVSHEFYAYATDSDGIPLMEDLYQPDATFTCGAFTKTGAYGNYGTAIFWGSLAAGTVLAEAHAHGLQISLYNFPSGTGRVEDISVMDDLHYTVPAGDYPDGVTVSISGHGEGIITSEVGAGAEAGLWVSHGAEVYQTSVLVAGVDEANTIFVNDEFTLEQQLVAPGTTLNSTVVYTRQVRILLHRGWTWSVSYNTGSGYVTGDGSIDFRTNGRGLRVTSVDVPPGVTWTSGSGIFLTATSDVPPLADAEKPVLHQNHPNPFNPVTTISFDLARSGPVDLEIFDLAGRRVRRLLHGDVQPAGPGQAVWRGDNDDGGAPATGVYLYRLRTGGTTLTQRMLLLR